LTCSRTLLSDAAPKIVRSAATGLREVADGDPADVAEGLVAEGGATAPPELQAATTSVDINAVDTDATMDRDARARANRPMRGRSSTLGVTAMPRSMR